MFSKKNALPDWEFIGGSSQKIVLRMLYEDTKRAIDLSDCTAKLSVVDSFGTDYDPFLIKDARIVDYDQDHGVAVPNGVELVLSPADTVELEGKYIYQVTLCDSSGRMEQTQGNLYIKRNIYPGYVLS